MASREFAEIETIAEIARSKDVAVGIIDVKSYTSRRWRTSPAAFAAA
jgi:hypothetical protein